MSREQYTVVCRRIDGGAGSGAFRVDANRASVGEILDVARRRHLPIEPLQDSRQESQEASDPTRRCGGCGYDLSGLPSEAGLVRCPECDAVADTYRLCARTERLPAALAVALSLTAWWTLIGPIIGLLVAIQTRRVVRPAWAIAGMAFSTACIIAHLLHGVIDAFIVVV